MTSIGGTHPTPDEVDTILDGTADAALLEHVHSCSECSQLLVDLGKVRDLLASSMTVPVLPDRVAERWGQALSSLPPYSGVDLDPTSLDTRPPRFDVTLPDGGHLSSRARGPVPLEAPGFPGTRHDVLPSTTKSAALAASDNGGSRGSSSRERRLRMVFALAAGAALVVGGGAAVFSVMRPPAPTSAASPSTDLARQGTQESRAAADGAGQPGAAEAPAAPFAAGDAEPSATPDTLGSEVQGLATAGTMRWEGVPADGVRARAQACATAVGTTGEVVATEPGSAPATQVLVVDSESGYIVVTVDSRCPNGEAPLLSQHFVPR